MVDEREDRVQELWAEYITKLQELKTLDMKLWEQLDKLYDEERIMELGSVENLEADLRTLLAGKEKIVGLGVIWLRGKARKILKKYNDDKAEGDTRVVCT